MESLAVENAGASRELLLRSEIESALDMESARCVESLTAVMESMAAFAESEMAGIESCSSSVRVFLLSLLERLSS